MEKPNVDQAPSNLGITGIYVLGPYIYDHIAGIKPGKNGEYQLADAYNSLVKEREVIAAIIEGKRYDIGTKEMWIRTFAEFAKKKGLFSENTQMQKMTNLPSYYSNKVQ